MSPWLAAGLVLAFIVAAAFWFFQVPVDQYTGIFG